MSGMSGIRYGRSPAFMTDDQNQTSIRTPMAADGYHITTGTALSLMSSRHPYRRVAIRAMALMRRGIITAGIEKGSIPDV